MLIGEKVPVWMSLMAVLINVLVLLQGDLGHDALLRVCSSTNILNWYRRSSTACCPADCREYAKARRGSDSRGPWTVKGGSSIYMVHYFSRLLVHSMQTPKLEKLG